MKIYVICGSPRKNGNTAQMCKAFAEGTKEAGAEVEIVHLYDLDYNGCFSCFACKLKGGKHYGECVYPDGLHELLQNVLHADGVVFASPIYFGDVTGQMRAFLERLFFPVLVYSKPISYIPPKKLATAVIYTMNVQERHFQDWYIGQAGGGSLGMLESYIGNIFSKPERLCAFNTYQFNYDNYVSDCWDKAAKTKSREEQFPKDLANAKAAGSRMAEKLKKGEPRP